MAPSTEGAGLAPTPLFIPLGALNSQPPSLSGLKRAHMPLSLNMELGVPQAL